MRMRRAWILTFGRTGRGHTERFGRWKSVGSMPPSVGGCHVCGVEKHDAPLSRTRIRVPEADNGSKKP